MPYEIYGRTSLQHGKTAWEILGNLKNHGVGRIIVRNQFKRYPEPSWYRILKVETLAPEGKVQVVPPLLDFGEIRRARVLVDKVFNGTYRGQEWIYWTTYKPDFSLIPKEEEESFTKVKRGELPSRFEPPRTLPRQGLFPPILRELLIRDMLKQGTFKGEEPMLTFVYNDDNIKKVVKEGETPSVQISPDLGTPVCPRLYANIKKE